MAVNKYFKFGGATVGSFIATTFPGTTAFSFDDGSNTNVSNTNYPLPTARFGSFAYAYDATFTAPSLTANATYQVIIDLCSNEAKSVNVDINGSRVITAYAPIAAGNILKGYSEVFEAVANSSGQITIRITGDGTGVGIINSAAFIEKLTGQPGTGRIYPL